VDGQARNKEAAMSNLGMAIVRQYERGVVFRLGKLRGVREPGWRFMIPSIDTLSLVITCWDGIGHGDRAQAHLPHLVRQQTTVRNVVGRSHLDQVLSETETLNEAIKEILDVTTERWGVLVELVELKDIELPQSMQRAMAREAEAEREKRGKIIAAEGEALSAGKLAEAADVIAKHPVALQLRNLQVLSEIAIEHNSTIIFPAQLMESVRAMSSFLDRETTNGATRVQVNH
jgi:regulator of protease activity HflC (stomatin/prohibitin superfamily)